MSLILAIDPGLANTGVVLMSQSMIYGAWTLKTKRDKSLPEFEDAIERGMRLAKGLEALFHEHFPLGVPTMVVESYKDIPGHLRGAKKRWAAPLVIGLLYPALDFLADEIVWQDPEAVMTASRDYIALWKAGRSVMTGDQQLTNEHTRSAAAHGIYYFGRGL